MTTQSRDSNATPRRWRACPRLPERRVAAAVASSLLLLAAVGFFPLFGGPGYEFSLASGLVLPSIMALTAAAAATEPRRTPLEALVEALCTALVTALLGAGVALAHGLRTTLCDPWRGLAIYALGGGTGALMGAVWGTWVGVGLGSLRLERRRLWRWLFAFAGPASGIAVSLWRFYASPMVYAFDPFFGYFAGPLYDTVLDPLRALADYRIGSFFSILASVLLCAQLEWNGGGRPKLRPRGPLMLLAALAMLMSAGLVAAGPALGHYNTATSVRSELSTTTRAGRCVVHHRPHEPAREMALLAGDCSATLSRLESWFGLTRGSDDVTVFLFSSPGDKGRLMGASRTYVAKPWRREIYLNAQGFPHSVLPHELAHLVAARFGRGPFRVAGPVWGVLPDPGRIEGFAVAAAPRGDSALSLEDAARAMRTLGILPPLERLFALSFLGYNASAGYAAAGAFVGWLRAEFGSASLRTWYAGATLEEATKTTPMALEHRWHQRLDSVELSVAQLGAAKDAFQRPAIFGRRCPRVVDQLQGEAARCLADGAVSEAEARYRRELRLDSHSLSARFGLAACAMRRDQPQVAEALYREILRRSSLTALERAATLEALGDLWLVLGSSLPARANYAEAARAHVNENALRSLEVKSQGETPDARSALIALLLGDRTGHGWPEAVEALVRWSERATHNALPEYLLGKNWFARGRYELAASHLDRALERGGLSPMARREAVRVRLLAACALGDRTRFEALARPRTMPGGITEDGVGDPELVARCRGLFAELAGHPM